MRRVYLAGPFRASTPWEIAQNVNRAAALALDAWRAGFAVFCPHLNTAQFQGSAPDSTWLQGDLAWLEVSDALLLTPDWSRSQGARAEVEFARARGIPIFYDLQGLIADEREQQEGAAGAKVGTMQQVWASEEEREGLQDEVR